MKLRIFRQRLRTRLYRRMRRRSIELVVVFVTAVLGLALGGSFFVGAQSVLQSLNASWEHSALQEGTFEMPQRGLDESGSIQASGIEQMPSGDLTGPGNSIVRVVPPREDLNLHTVVQGRDVTNNSEILLDARYAEAHGLEIGNNVTVGGFDYSLVGLVVLPEYIAVKNSQVVLQPNPDEFGVGLVTREAFTSAVSELTVTYAYNDEWTPSQVVDRYDPVTIRDTANDSRVQQAIGDSAAPRDLAAVIFIIFAAIIAALSAVYHYQTRTTERQNRLTFRQLGLDAGIERHYRTDTRLVLLAAGIVSTLIMVFSVKPVMELNGQLYNYPSLTVNWPLLVAVAVLGTLALLLIDVAVAFLIDKGGSATSVDRAPRRRGFTLETLRFLPDFGYRLRLIRAVRRPGEVLAVVALLSIVSIFVTFSLTLKASVDEWRTSLEGDTPYAFMYTPPQGVADRINLRDGDERASMAVLYNDDGVAQMVYVVPDDSRFFGSLSGPAATDAFGFKYSVDMGDKVHLTNLDGSGTRELALTGLVENSTSAFLYVPLSQAEELLGDVPMADVVFTTDEHPELQDIAPVVTRHQIVSSGESITRIISMQVVLLVAIAVLLLVMMLFAIARFVIGGQRQLITTLTRNGHSPGVIIRALFGLTVPVALLCGLAAQAVAGSAVRAFFDQIMFRFVNFVPVSESWWVPTFTVGGITVALLGMVAVAYYRIRRIDANA